MATHIIGGSISFTYLGGDNYEIRLEVLRDCLFGAPDAQFDDPASIGIYNQDGNLIYHLLVPYTTDDTVSFDNVCIFSPGVCVHKALYRDTAYLPWVGSGYSIAYQRCCRSGIISNLISPLNTGMTFQTHLNPVFLNSSPVFKNDFPFAVFTNTPFVYDASATDPDHDSVSYELVHPFIGADPIDNMPQPPPPPPYSTGMFRTPYSVDNMLGGQYPLTIDPATGEMTAIPPTTGFFQIAYAVKEYRGGEHIGTTFREFAFVVIQPPPDLNFDVSGSVLINDTTPLDLGTVQLLRRDISTDSLYLYDEQDIGPGATYSFENIPAGVFYIKALVDTGSIYYDSYLPTYYNSAVFWYKATPINQCDTSQYYRDIHLIHVDSLSGFYSLEGIVNHAGRSFTPVPSLHLILANENGVPIQARTTSGEGVFKFENLVLGKYLLFADLLNSSIDNTHPPLIDLNSNTTITVFLYEDSLSLQMPTSLDPDIKQNDILIKLYPNPASEELVLESFNQEFVVVRFELLSMDSKSIISGFIQGGQKEHLDIAYLLPGVYILSVVSQESTNAFMFLKYN